MDSRAPDSEAATDPAARPAGVPEVVAKIGDASITWDELFSEVGGDLVQADIARAEARQNALDQLVLQRLLEKEAEKRGLTVDALIQAEVQEKVTPPTEEEVRAFYEQNKSQMQGPVEVEGQRIAQFLYEKQAQAAFLALMTRLKEEAGGVETFLPRYRIEVAAKDGPRRGPEKAPVEIVEFSDFQCPYCSDAAETAKQLSERYGDKVSLVYRNFPLPMHGQAHRAAEASLCAKDQDKFWDYHDALFGDQKAWTDEDFVGYATAAGLDADAFRTCLTEGKHAEAVDSDIADGRKVGMSATPGFYVNGIPMQGSQPIEAFAEVIDAELARVTE
ncbi:MAG: thioredoxin domain-containing protein [Myxococcota bacterium]